LRIAQIERAEDRQVKLDPVQCDEERRECGDRWQHQHAKDDQHDEGATAEGEAAQWVGGEDAKPNACERRAAGNLE